LAQGRHIETMSNAAQKIAHEGDDTETAQLRAAVEESRAAERRGEIVSHDRVRAWLLAMAAGERPSPPRP
jgi:hypothetical protein